METARKHDKDTEDDGKKKRSEHGKKSPRGLTIAGAYHNSGVTMSKAVEELHN